MFESSCEVALDFFLSKYLLIREKTLLLLRLTNSSRAKLIKIWSLGTLFISFCWCFS